MVLERCTLKTVLFFRKYHKTTNCTDIAIIFLLERFERLG